MTPADLIRARYGALPFDPPAEIPPALAALLDRRVTRRYRADDIAEPLLDTVLAAAQSAPSKSDLQQFSIVVTRDKAKIAKVADVHFGVGFWAFAGVMLCTAAAVSGIDREELWDRMEVARS